MSTAASPAGLRAWICRLTPMDMALLGLVFWLVWYALFNVFSVLVGADWSFDYMLITGGATFLAVALPASHVGDRTKRVLQDLDDSGAVTFATETERDELQGEMERIGRRYGWYGFSFLIAMILLGLLAAQSEGRQPLGLMLTLGLVLVVCAGYAGFRFGQFYANGHLFRLLEERGHDLRGGGNLVAQAIIPLRQLYSIAVIATLVLCGFFNLWWLGWAMHLPVADAFSQWRFPFLVLSVVGVLALLVVGLVPVQRFNRRLTAIQGSAEERRSMVVRQRALVLADLASIDQQYAALSGDDGSQRARAALLVKRAGLEDYLQGLSNRTYRDWLMRPRTILLVAAASAAAVALCVAVTGVPDLPF